MEGIVCPKCKAKIIVDELRIGLPKGDERPDDLVPCPKCKGPLLKVVMTTPVGGGLSKACLYQVVEV